MRFFRTPALLPWLFPSLTWRIKTSEKLLCLTFDDGPVPGPTEFVLDVLKSKNIKATFFCIGNNIKQHPGLFARIGKESHNIGNHTFNHADGWKVSTPEYEDEVRTCQALINAPGAATNLFRPPYGRITPGKVRALKDHHIVMWDVLTYDFDNRITPDECLAESLNVVRPGSIIIFHDSYKAEKNMTHSLPRFIDSCRSDGYEFRQLLPAT